MVTGDGLVHLDDVAVDIGRIDGQRDGAGPGDVLRRGDGGGQCEGLRLGRLGVNRGGEHGGGGGGEEKLLHKGAPRNGVLLA